MAIKPYFAPSFSDLVLRSLLCLKLAYLYTLYFSLTDFKILNFCWIFGNLIRMLHGDHSFYVIFGVLHVSLTCILTHIENMFFHDICKHVRTPSMISSSFTKTFTSLRSILLLSFSSFWIVIFFLFSLWLLWALHHNSLFALTFRHMDFTLVIFEMDESYRDFYFRYFCLTSL